VKLEHEFQLQKVAISYSLNFLHTTDVLTIDALKLFAKIVFCEGFQFSRRKYRGTSMFKTLAVSKHLAHLIFKMVFCCDCDAMRSDSHTSVILFFYGHSSLLSHDHISCHYLHSVKDGQ